MISISIGTLRKSLYNIMVLFDSIDRIARRVRNNETGSDKMSKHVKVTYKVNAESQSMCLEKCTMRMNVFYCTM